MADSAAGGAARSGGGAGLDAPDAAAEPDAAAIEAGRLLFCAPCRFATAASRLDGLPPPGLPEIALAGRSNVGKSSLINALTNHAGLARASRQPGRTQQLNFFDLGGRATLVDMPGYGFAEAPVAAKREWQALMFGYLRGRPTLARALLLLDARIEVKASDLETMAMLDRAGVTYQVVLTKADGLKPPALARKRADVIALARKHPAAFPLVIATSAARGDGVPELRAAVATVLAGLG